MTSRMANGLIILGVMVLGFTATITTLRGYDDQIARLSARNTELLQRIEMLETENEWLEDMLRLTEGSTEILREHIEALKQRHQLEEMVEELRTIPGATVTSYAPLDPNAVEGVCYSGNPNITATGTQVREGVAAADLSRLPAGTVIEVPGYGEAVIEDSGGDMRNAKNIHVDLFMVTRGAALNWGRQTLDIKIKPEGYDDYYGNN